MRRCVILGGGGHARVVIEILRAAGEVVPAAVLDRDSARWGGDVLGIPVVGGDELLPQMARDGIDAFVVGIGSVRDNRPRQRLYEQAVAQGLVPVSAAHPSSVCSATAEIGAGSLLFPLSAVNAGAKVGVNVVVNTGAIVEHDCVIGDHVHVATGARLASTVRVGTGAHIGAGAVVRQCITIGEYAVVGAGAVVVRDVPPGMVVAGVPARPLASA